MTPKPMALSIEGKGEQARGRVMFPPKKKLLLQIAVAYNQADSREYLRTLSRYNAWAASSEEFVMRLTKLIA